MRRLRASRQREGKAITVASGSPNASADILNSLNANGRLQLGDATELTISGGIVTNVVNIHTIDTEADAATDDLDTITIAADVGNGYVLVISPAHDARTVVVKHGTGNIQCFGNADIVLDDDHDTAILIYSSTLAAWKAVLGNIGATGAAGTSGTVIHGTCQGRLTLTSGLPVTIADVTGATTIYFTPYKGNQIGLYDGVSAWTVLNFAETSIALGTLTTGLPYDVFAYNNGGTLAFDAPLAWTNGTTRATALTLQNGILVKTGDTSRRYIGTFTTTSTTQTEDSANRRYLWNYYNRVQRFLNCADATNTWNYTTATWREVQAGSTVGTSRVLCVIGWREVLVQAEALGIAETSASGSDFASGVGIDSTSANSALTYGFSGGGVDGSIVVAKYRGYPAVGNHVISQLEISRATGVTSWYGDNGVSYVKAGMVVEMEA